MPTYAGMSNKNGQERAVWRGGEKWIWRSLCENEQLTLKKTLRFKMGSYSKLFPLLKALFYNPPDETTLGEEWVEYLLIFVGIFGRLKVFLPSFGRYDSMSRTAGIIDFSRAEFF